MSGGNPILTVICIRLAFIVLQYGNIAVDPILLVLGNAFCDPYNVSDLLLLELDVRIKHTIVELLLECQTIQKHFVLKELVFQCLANSWCVKEWSIFLKAHYINTISFSTLFQIPYMKHFASSLDLFKFIGNGKLCVSFRIQSSNHREKFLAIFLGQFSAKRVDSDVDGTTIGFKLIRMCKYHEK